MKIQVNTDNHVTGGASITRKVETEVEAALGRFAEQVTRVEVHLNDVNGPKSAGMDKRCLMEARHAGLQPIAVSHDASSWDEAIEGAAGKLERILDSTLGRLGDPKGRTSFGGDQTI